MTECFIPADARPPVEEVILEEAWDVAQALQDSRRQPPPSPLNAGSTDAQQDTADLGQHE